jgi:hypothetical protein
MGILIGDSITFTNGLSASNCYCSFYNNTINIEKNESSNYNISGSACIWVSKNFRDQNSPILDRVNIGVTITSSQLDTNVYTHLYNSLKSMYTNATDDL